MHGASSHDDTLATSTSVLVFLDLDFWPDRLLHARRADNDRQRLFLPSCSRLLGLQRCLNPRRSSFFEVVCERQRRHRPWRGYRRRRRGLRSRSNSRLWLLFELSSSEFIHRTIVFWLYFRVIITKCSWGLEGPSAKTPSNKSIIPRTGATSVSRLRGSTTSFFAITPPLSLRTPYPSSPIAFATVGSTTSSQFPSLGIGVVNTGIASTSVVSVVDSEPR